MAEVHELVTVPVSCHCWNGNRTSELSKLLKLEIIYSLIMCTPSPPPFEISEFAMSPNNNEVHIYAKKGTKWEVEHILKEVYTYISSLII
jgi:hypothetical protein